jgi:hypothetical protein
MNLCERIDMNLYGVAATLCFVVWVMLAFVLALPTGWVHIPLILGVFLIVKAIVDSKRE